MNSKQRKDVFNTGIQNGFKQSSVNPNRQYNSYGQTITHVGTNRTIVNGTTYYGAADAKSAIKKGK